MQRCINLARNGVGRTAPNPMVGCVIVHKNRIIGEGYHVEYGTAHAEVNAVASVKNPEWLRECTLYVNLEPCAHYGKTPPCSDLILDKKIPHVVIGTVDPFAEVAGKGIEKLRNGGIKVDVGVLQEECRWLNRRFFTFHEKRRPYVILKWAQSPDGYTDAERTSGMNESPIRISGIMAGIQVHKMRTEEAAILIGTETALKDNPRLTARYWSGSSPLRVVIDRTGRLPGNLHVFDGETSTLVFTEIRRESSPNLIFRQIDFYGNVPARILMELHQMNIQSLIIEGGTITLQRFIDSNLWDEAHIYSGNKMLFSGTKAPLVSGICVDTVKMDDTLLTYLINPTVDYRP